MTIPDGEPEFYPGSKKKREPARVIEFLADPWRENYVTKTLGGEQVRMYTVGSFAEALGVSVPTLRAWTNQGRIPQAPYRLPSNMVVKGERVAGRRLYTEEIIDATVTVFERNGLLGQRRIVWANHPEVPIEIISVWNRLLSSDQDQ